MTGVPIARGGGGMRVALSTLVGLSSAVYASPGQGCTGLCGVDAAQHAPERIYEARPLDRVPIASGFRRGASPIEDGSLIDVLVVWTSNVQASLGAAEIESRIETAFLNTNAALTDSLASTQFRVVHAQEVAYFQSGSMGTQLENLREFGDGVLDEVHELRDEHKADLVMMITTSSEVCGIANLGYQYGTPRPDLGFSVVSSLCFGNGSYTAAHELGHNLGLMHDWEDTPCTNGTQRYGKGYTSVSGDYSTIMAISPLPGVRYYSNPDVLINGEPAGEMIGSSTESHAVQAIDDAALAVSRFRDRDMDANGVLDETDIAMGLLDDCNSNGYPDPFETDFNKNGIPDDCDFAAMTSDDLDRDGVPDEAEAPRVYVDIDAGGAGTGLNWSDAFNNLHDALELARASGDVDEIWVAQGTYRTNNAGERMRFYDLHSGTSLYGGFVGTETALDQRPDSGAETILSADTLGDDLPGGVNRSDNTMHVLYAVEEPERIVIDRFTITGGAADADVNCDNFLTSGGGLFVFQGDVVVRGCRFVENTGAIGSAMTISNGTESRIAGNVFENNKAVDVTVSTVSGAFEWLGSVTVELNGRMDGEDNQFVNNTVRYNESNGGTTGVRVNGGNPVFANNVIVRNTGYGLYTNAAVTGILNENLEIVNCTIAYNDAPNMVGPYTVGVYSSRGVVRLVNSVVWMNRGPASTLSGFNSIQATGSGAAAFADYSIVDQWWPGLDGVASSGADPMFMDPTNDGFKLAAMSPGIDAGDSTRVPADFLDLDDDADTAELLPIDSQGGDRFVDDPGTIDTGVGPTPLVDLGAFERQPDPCPADLSGDGVASFPDVGIFLGLFATSDPAADFNGDGAVSFPDVGAFLAAFQAGCP